MKLMAFYSLGIYIRLSQADFDLAKKEGKTESESISHQRDLIQRYIQSNPEFAGMPQQEFFDDGFSGTNFDRPSFERMLDKIRIGEINCVIVKDFSRFGRNYIELGDYLERIFPFLGVRFISINDQYDSNDYKGTTGGLDVVMKNILYDYYSKDLSVKVSTAKRAKMKRGEYIGGHVPFGLRKHPSIKNKLELDPEAAGIVRHVFELAINGIKTAEIAAQLNEEEVVTPGAYFQKTHPDTRKFRNTTEQMSWNSTMVLKILQQEMYYGAVVGHKRKGTEVGWKHSIAVPKDEQVIVEGMHESIVTKEEFLKANEVVRKMKSPSSRIARDYPLRTVARCAGCGRALQYYPRLKRPYYLCNSSKYAVETVCCQEKMYEDVINEAVWQALQSLFALSDELSGRLKKKKAALGNDQEAYRLSIAEMQRKLTKLNTDKFANMDRYMSGEMDKTVYLKLRSEMDQQIASLSESITALERKLQAVQAEASDEASTVLANIKKYAGEKQLTNEMVLAFIKKVLITDGEHIEIQWNFSDVFLQYLKTE